MASASILIRAAVLSSGAPPSQDGRPGADFTDPRPDHAGPLPAVAASTRGLYLNGERVDFLLCRRELPILESFDLENG